MIEDSSDTDIITDTISDNTERQLPVFSENEKSDNITSDKQFITEEVFSKYFFGELMAHALSITDIDEAITVQYNMQGVMNIINAHTEKLQKEYDDKFFKDRLKQKTDMIRQMV